VRRKKPEKKEGEEKEGEKEKSCICRKKII